jgi:hypothetical protein
MRGTARSRNGIAQNLVVHVAALRNETRVLDIAHDLDFVHAVARPCRADDVLFDHHAAHVVGAVREAELPHLPTLRHPGRLQVVEVVEHRRAVASVRR